MPHQAREQASKVLPSSGHCIEGGCACGVVCQQLQATLCAWFTWAALARKQSTQLNTATGARADSSKLAHEKTNLQKHCGNYKKTKQTNKKLRPVLHTACRPVYMHHMLCLWRVSLHKEKKKAMRRKRQRYTTKAVKPGQNTIVTASAILCLNYEIVAYYNLPCVTASLL